VPFQTRGSSYRCRWQRWLLLLFRMRILLNVHAIQSNVSKQKGKKEALPNQGHAAAATALDVVVGAQSSLSKLNGKKREPNQTRDH